LDTAEPPFPLAAAEVEFAAGFRREDGAARAFRDDADDAEDADE
jgi:hypothetical protein